MADIIFGLAKWVIAVVFIYAGIIKVLHPHAFVEDIDNYRMLPYLMVTILAVVMPWVEILSGVFLLYGRYKKGAALSLMVLTFIFLVAITSAVARGLDISCGCFGIDNEATRVSFMKMIEDLVLFIFIFFIFKRQVQGELKSD
jgi:uncharacterized membrane protein YphA (DoxX/SURF4 family)